MFAGGWTLEAAEVVCVGGDVEDWEILDLLTSLCDKSLVVAEPSGTSTRYRLLETVRQYSRDRLLENGDGEAFRNKHLAFFLTLAEETEPQINGPRMKEILDRLEAELDNFRAAREWSGGGSERVEASLRVALATWYFMARRISLTEGQKQLSRATASSEDVSPSLRAKGFYLLGARATTFQDYVAARRFLEASLEIRQELGERLGVAQTLNALGTLATYQEDYGEARQRYEESLLI